MMPLVFAIYLAAVRQLGVEPALLFGFLFVVNAGLLAIAVIRREELMHAMGALATLLVFAVWIANASLGRHLAHGHALRWSCSRLSTLRRR